MNDAAKTTGQDPAEMRRAPRDDVALPTRMINARRQSVDVLLVNISPLGFMVREYGETPKGSIVKLLLPRLGEWEATVMWSLGGRIGAQFTKPIEPLAYAAMLQAARARRQRWPMG